MERRKAPRYKKRLGIRFWSKEQPQPKKGITLNLSQNGAFIATFTPFSVGTWTTLELPLGKRSIQLQGLVRSSVRVDPALRRIKQSGMGVRFLKTEELIQGILGPREDDDQGQHSDPDSSNAESASRSADEPDSAIFSVYVNTPMDLEEMFRRHIRHGGVYVPTPGIAKVKEQVGLQFLFDWSPETVIQATGKVVKTFAAAPSSNRGAELAGIGVAFTSPDETIGLFQQLLGSSDSAAAEGSAP